MNEKLLLFLLIGTIAMAIPLLKMAKNYGISKGRTLALTLMLTMSGTVGTFLMYYVENKNWGGLSFYGAVFLVPAIFLVIAPILKIPYSSAMDLCAVGECIMLSLMKIHCIIGGCCQGREIFIFSNGESIRFPSRIVEMLVAIVLFVILFKWSKKGNRRCVLYSWYMLLYGCTRFGLNILRESWVEKNMILPFGNIWSLIAIVIGGIWIVLSHKNKYYAYRGNGD